MEYWNLWEMRSKGSIVERATKGWGFKKRCQVQWICSNDVGVSGLKQQLCLGDMKTQEGEFQSGHETDHRA
jgi:hypothetical protein